MKFVMDQNIRAAAETFDRLGEVLRLDGREIKRKDLHDADALIVRSVTRVDASLLEGTPVRFVGTTTIGTDHLDIPWLEKNGVAWASAPGCNADAAAQYTLAIAWLACQRLGISLRECSVGIVGCGNVGSRVRNLMTAVGARTIANDPPLQEQGRPGFLPLENALACDIVCLHTPLTRHGPHPSYHLVGRDQLARMPDGALLINTGRGDVAEGAALLDALESGRLHAALDVWPGEPRIDRALLQAVTVATPHVAGYSDDGKRNGTLMVHREFCSFAGLTGDLSDKPEDHGRELDLVPGRDGLSQALNAACFVEQHDRAMRELAPLIINRRAQAFDRLRRNYPPRRDFQAWRIRGADGPTGAILERLGFLIE